MIANKALNQYANVGRRTAVEGATPHQLIMMLYDGVLESLMKATGCIQRKDFAAKGAAIGKAINIIGGLQSFLDMEKGGEVSANLDRLYDYMTRRLYDATVSNDIAIISEVANLIKTVREGWEGIREEANKIHEQNIAQQAQVKVES
ncbi:Flagellar protein [gamma proteobacterium HdN1]|nr:Flagellar protein [gamma proteobacterium HdN1]